MRAHASLPDGRNPVGRFAAGMAIFALALLCSLAPAALLADTPAKTQKHAVSHPNAHPETQSKKRDAEAKKRLAKDREQQRKDKKQQAKANRAGKERKAHPASQPISRRSRRDRAAKPRVAAKPGTTAAVNTATASRVHAWVASQKTAQPLSNEPAAAAPAPAAANPSGSETNPSDTGTSNPPPDTAQTDLQKPVSAISLVRTSTEKPQLPPVEDLAAEPVILPTLYTRRGRLVVPPPLKGSHEILLRQNQVADDEGLGRIQNDSDLDRMRAAGLLIALPANSALLHTDDRLPLNRRYCRPWTALFLDTLARQHYARFQTTLQLTSAVRTVEFQQRLIHTNGNAAPAEGDTASPHLTGQAVDIGKKGLSTAEIAWLRGYLLPLVQQGKVDVEEEFQQSCFHISVYKKYLPQAGAGRRSIASTHGSGIETLATGLR